MAAEPSALYVIILGRPPYSLIPTLLASEGEEFQKWCYKAT
jgi:hypothetical protein